jgi:uncharacterized membrane protein YedE/YeeE
MVVPIAAFVSGLLFGLGLLVSQMINPAKVLAFLDLAGNWDPSLALVMVGALAVTLPGFRLAARRQPMFAQRMQIPMKRDIDLRLVLGAGLFGIGWGLVGFCPGPALAALATGKSQVFLFVAAVIAGALVARLVPVEGASGGRVAATGE